MNRVADGFCGCGCGQRTTIATFADRRNGAVKGQPRRFVRGHHMRLREFRPPKPVAAGRLNFRVIAETGCWQWMGGVDRNGYGKVRVRSKTLWAHRHSYEQLRGPIPPGMSMHHTCGNRACINPDHLRLMESGEAARCGKHAKLDRAKVDEILRDFAGGTGTAELARRYGVHRSTIQRAIRGTYWGARVEPAAAGAS